MQVRVKLSSDPLIEFFSFCQAIAEAVCPTGENGLKGIDCVVGKIVKGHCQIPEAGGFGFGEFRPSWQSVLLSEDGRTLNELLPTDHATAISTAAGELPLTGAGFRANLMEYSQMVELNDADCDALAKVLPLLPPLMYPMSEEDRTVFMEAYFKFPNRPMWVPDLVTEGTINQRKARQHHCLIDHQQTLRKEFEAGSLIVVDSRHVTVLTLMAGTFIPRAQAIAYLERQGLAYDDGTPRAAEPNRPVSCIDDPEKPESSDMALAANEDSNRVGKKKVSDSERKAAVKLYWELKETETDFAKQVAEKYFVSERTINKWVKKEADEKKRRSASPFSHGK